MLRKFIITVICCMSILLLCVVTSYAQSFHTTDSTRSFDSDNLNFSKTPTLLSFDELSSLCVQVNADLSSDKFSSHLRSYSCSVGMFSLGSVSYYGIRLVYNGQALWYRNANGGLFYALDNTDSLLSSISRVTSAISAKVSTISDTLTTLTNGVASIYTKLSSIDDTVLIGTGTLNNIYNYLTGDLTTYLQSIDSSVGGSETFLGQISTKMDSVVNTLTTENGKNSLFYPITQRLDTIIDRIVPAYSQPFAHRGWCLSGDDMSSLSVSDVGYSALSSMMETVTEEYLSYHFFAGSYFIDVLDSLSIVHATVGGNTGYFIQGTGTLSKSVNGINEFYEDQTFYLGESNNTLFYASDDSRGSAGTVNLSTVESYLSRTVNHLSGLSDKLTYLFGEYEELYQFPVLGSTSGTVRGVSSSSFSVSAYDMRLFVSRDSRVSGASSGVSYGGEFSGYPYTLYNVGSGFVYREVIPATYDFMDALISAGFSSDSFNSVRTIAISEYEFENVPVEAILEGDSFIIQVGIVPEWEDPFNIDSNALSGFRISDAYFMHGEINFLNSPAFYDVGISYSFPRLISKLSLSGDSFSGYYYSVCSDPFTHQNCDCGSYPVVYSSRFTGFMQEQFDRVIEKLGFTGVTSRLDAILAQLQTSGGSSSCDHTYTQEMEQEATCGLPGLMVSTCSKCGNCYSEIVGALDHDWILSEHVEEVKDPATDEVTQAAYDIYTCSRCGQTYEDHTGAGAPADYGETSIAKIIVKLFAKLGTLAGKIIGWIVDLFTKTLGGINDLFTRFTELTAQIISFGGDYPAWLTGFWGVLSPDLQLALSFAFLCTFVGIIGKKLFFS